MFYLRLILGCASNLNKKPVVFADFLITEKFPILCDENSSFMGGSTLPPIYGSGLGLTFNWLLRCFWKRRQVVLEQTVVQARWDLWLLNPPCLSAPPLPVKSRCYPLEKCHPPTDMSLPHRCCHSPHWHVTPPQMLSRPMDILTPPLWLVTPPGCCHPHWHVTPHTPMDVTPPSHGARQWWQRSTLAFGAKSLVCTGVHGNKCHCMGTTSTKLYSQKIHNGMTCFEPLFLADNVQRARLWVLVHFFRQFMKNVQGFSFHHKVVFERDNGSRA